MERNRAKMTWSEEYLEPSKISKMELFAKIFNMKLGTH